MQIDDPQLQRAMKLAVEHGLLPQHPVDTGTYMQRWDAMAKVLEAITRPYEEALAEYRSEVDALTDEVDKLTDQRDAAEGLNDSLAEKLKSLSY